MGRFAFIASFLACCMFVCRPADCNSNSDNSTISSFNRNEASARLVHVAEKYIGLEELTGNNDHPQIQEWLLLTGLKGRYPWCAAAQAGVHTEAGIANPKSARVVDWYKQNVLWERKTGAPMWKYVNVSGMVGAIYYKKLKRYGHIVLIVGEDKNNYYTIEGNTNAAGSREGQGYYRKIRPKSIISAIADYCVPAQNFHSFYKFIDE